jgi:hypothetical protein
MTQEEVFAQFFGGLLFRGRVVAAHYVSDANSILFFVFYFILFFRILYFENTKLKYDEAHREGLTKLILRA